MKKLTAIMLMLALALTAMISVGAADRIDSSENPGSDYRFDLCATEGGKAGYILNEDRTITVTADPKEGHTFREWVINGDYEIVENDEKSLTIRVKALSDVTIMAAFDDETEPVVWYTVEENSPQTGYDMTALAVLSVVSLLGAAVCTKHALAK